MQPHVVLLRIRPEVIDPRRSARGTVPYQPPDLVALGQQQLSQIGAVLSGDARDQRPAAVARGKLLHNHWSRKGGASALRFGRSGVLRRAELSAVERFGRRSYLRAAQRDFAAAAA